MRGRPGAAEYQRGFASDSRVVAPSPVSRSAGSTLSPGGERGRG
jgi:hypothetical protein